MNFTAWDVTLTLAVLLQLTKASDLILRKHQQDWVNRICDSIALYLDEIKPLTWFRMVRSNMVQKVLVGVSIIVFALVSTLVFLVSFVAGHVTDDLAGFVIVSTVVSLAVNIVVLFKEGPTVVDDIFSVDSFGAFLKNWGEFLGKQYRVLIPVGIALRLVTVLFFLGFGNNLFTWVLVTIPALVFSAFQSLASMGLMSGLIVIFAQLILYCLSILVPIFRAIAWRVVEYNKGAWAALTLIGTVALGVVDVYMRAINKV